MKVVPIKSVFAVMTLALAAAPALAQSCPCPGASRTANSAALAQLLAGKMVCASLGNERWQEWHDGKGLAGGSIVDYKRGPTAAKDPSRTVGSYMVTGNNTVRYTYGSNSYEYEVCRAGLNYTYCGSPYGGRDFAGVVIGGDGTLQDCSTVTSAPVPRGGRGAGDTLPPSGK